MTDAIESPTTDHLFSVAVCERINRRIEDEQRQARAERHWLPSRVERVVPLLLDYEYLRPRLPYFRTMLMEGGPVVYPDAQSANDHSWFSINPAAHMVRARRQLAHQRRRQQAVLRRLGLQWVRFDENLVGWPYHSRRWLLWGAPLTSAALHKSFYYSLLSQLVDLSRVSSVIDIGGGFGGLLSAVLAKHPRMTGCLVDLPRMCVLASHYLERCVGDVALVVEDPVSAPQRIRVALPWVFDRMESPADLAINTMSFQHMSRANHEYYFSNLARLGVARVFSVNREEPTREGEDPFLPTARKHGYQIETTLSLEPWSEKHRAHLLVA